MAQFAARIYRERGTYRAVVDGWGTVEGATLAEATQQARRMLLGVLDAAYPDRSGIEPRGAHLVVWFEVELRESRGTGPAGRTSVTRVGSRSARGD